MGASKKTRPESLPLVVEQNRPVTPKASIPPLSERIKPWLVRPARRWLSSHYTLRDIEKAIDLAG
jgi:hypothetical protein